MRKLIAGIFATVAGAVIAASAAGAPGVNPSGAPPSSGAVAGSPAFALQWQRTWNHRVERYGNFRDAFDVATSLAAAGGAVYAFGYAEDLGSPLLSYPFVTTYAPDGDQLLDSLLLFYVDSEVDRVDRTGNLIFVGASTTETHFLSVFDTSNSSYTFPTQIAWEGPSSGESVDGMTAQSGNAYVLTDVWAITRGDFDQITKWTHEIHLKMYDSTPAIVWDRVLAPEVSGLIGSDDSGLYVLSPVVQDYDIDDPPPSNPPVFLTKFTFDGALLWQRLVYQDTATVQTSFVSMTVGADAIYIAGSTRSIDPQGSPGVAQIIVNRLDKLGQTVWSEVYDAGAPDLDKWYAIVRIGASSLFVAADLTVSNVFPGNTDVVALKLDFDGGALASSSWGGPTEDYQKDAIAVGDDFYVAGYTLSYTDPSGYSDAFLLKFSEATADVTPPQIVAQVSGVAGSAGWYRSDVVVTWNVSDPESGIGSSSGCGETVLAGDTPGATLTCTATNGIGLSSSAQVIVKIDETAPIVGGMPAPGCMLWPPNHKLVDVAQVTAADALSGMFAFAVFGASSEAPDSGESDIVIGGVDLQPRAVRLRAERDEDGPGRTYTLTATARDAAGNSATATAVCTVPHDLGR